jgi:thiol-disulfide isomerase/thioredoxin
MFENHPIIIKNKIQLIDEIKNNSDKLLIFMFTASWCGPCKRIKQEIDNSGNSICRMFGYAQFFYIDVEENEEILTDFPDIKSMPTFVFNRIENGKLTKLDTLTGAETQNLIQLIQKYRLDRF